MWCLSLIREINESPEKFAWAITGEVGVARRLKVGRLPRSLARAPLEKSGKTRPRIAKEDTS